MEPLIYGVGEVSKATGISIGTITRYRKEGLVKASIILGKRHFYNTQGLETIRQIYKENQERLREKS